MLSCYYEENIRFLFLERIVEGCWQFHKITWYMSTLQIWSVYIPGLAATSSYSYFDLALLWPYCILYQQQGCHKLSSTTSSNFMGYHVQLRVIGMWFSWVPFGENSLSYMELSYIYPLLITPKRMGRLKLSTIPWKHTSDAWSHTARLNGLNGYH